MRKYLTICFFLILFLTSCDSNKKLNQANAEKTLREFVKTHPSEGWNGCGFNENSIRSIEPISQFSETMASAIVDLNCELKLKFNFQKNIDNKWVLMNIERSYNGGYNNGIVESLIIPNQNINMIVQ